MQGDDLYSGAALGGAASGAASGAMMGSSMGPWGTAGGAVVGGAIGLFGGAQANSMRDNATSQQSKRMDQILANMRAMGSSNYDQHIADLKKALAFYGPAQQSWDRLYSPGTGGAQTGTGSWAGTNISGK